MFADTLTITVNSVAKILTRINQDGYSSEYFLREALGEFRLKIRNTSYKDSKLRSSTTVDRHNVEFIHTLYPVSPATVPVIRKMYTVLENQTGDSLVEAVKFAAGLIAFHSEANMTKMLNWES